MPLELIIEKTIPNMTVHCVNQHEIWTSSNYTLYLSKDEGNSFKKAVDLRVPLLIRILGKFWLPARALRLGVRSLRILKSGTFLAIANRKILRGEELKFTPVYYFKNSVGPLRDGWCEDDRGDCYLAEYFLNNKRKKSVDLLKSMDDGRTWKIIRSWHNIRHIHYVQYDPFDKRIWLGTGDKDEESRILFSQDGGESWIDIGSGDQMFRAVSLLFTENYVYWGTDAPTRQNYICRYERQSGQIERLAPVDGPVYYSAILGNGIKLFATAAEGNSEGKSAEWDNKAHIWASQDGTHWEDVISWQKDFWPYILGYGIVYFAHGQSGNNVYLTTQSLRNVDRMLTRARLAVEGQ